MRLIPPGRVATYGQLAGIAGCTARQAGYAMAAAPDKGLPWQRVVNAQGMISERKGGGGQHPQRNLLEAEGVAFDRRGRLDLKALRWPGPDPQWLMDNGYDPGFV